MAEPQTPAPELVELLRSALIAAECYAPVGTPDYADHYRRNRGRLDQQVRNVLAALAATQPAATPAIPPHLLELRAQHSHGKWRLWEPEGDWDHDDLYGRVQSATHDIADFFDEQDAKFIVALVNWFDQIASAAPSADATTAESQASGGER